MPSSVWKACSSIMAHMLPLSVAANAEGEVIIIHKSRDEGNGPLTLNQTSPPQDYAQETGGRGKMGVMNLTLVRSSSLPCAADPPANGG